VLLLFVLKKRKFLANVKISRNFVKLLLRQFLLKWEF